MDFGLISIILPVFNRSETIVKTVNSLLKQSYQNIEIILVDDASTDISFGINQLFVRHDPRVRALRNSQNMGVSVTRNHGLKVAKGDWIVFVDADDWVEADYIENFVKMAQKSEAELLISGHLGDHSLARLELPFSKKMMTSREVIEDVIGELGPIGGYPWNKMFKRSIIQRYTIRFHEEISFLEDELFTIEYAQHINKAYYDSKAYYHYEIQEDSLSVNGLSKMLPAIKQRDAILLAEGIDPDDYRHDPISVSRKDWGSWKENLKTNGSESF